MAAGGGVARICCSKFNMSMVFIVNSPNGTSGLCRAMGHVWRWLRRRRRLATSWGSNRNHVVAFFRGPKPTPRRSFLSRPQTNTLAKNKCCSTSKTEKPLASMSSRTLSSSVFPTRTSSIGSTFKTIRHRAGGQAQRKAEGTATECSG